MKIVVSITGASGVIIGLRLLEELAKINNDLSAIITENANDVIEHELEHTYSIPENVTLFSEFDQTAPFNSSSHPLDAMIIAPCSMKTLAAIASGYSHSLVTRSAENVLRTRKKLILLPRETPFSETALENMLRLHRAGAIMFPPNVAYYHHPRTVDDITNFFIGKILDLLNVPNQLYQRWNATEFE